MAPSKAARATAHDDTSKSEAMKEKENHNAHTKAPTNGKGRQAGVAAAKAAAAAEKAAAAQSAAKASAANASANHAIDWSSFDRKTLHNYRREYRIDTPTTFANSYRHRILSLPGGVGKYSPTMLRRGKPGPGTVRQTKDQLQLAVRKHFNAMMVVENDVIASLIHKISQDDAEAARRQLSR
jgi:histone deacetylase complex subunit SAP30